MQTRKTEPRQRAQACKKGALLCNDFCWHFQNANPLEMPLEFMQNAVEDDNYFYDSAREAAASACFPPIL